MTDKQTIYGQTNRQITIYRQSDSNIWVDKQYMDRQTYMERQTIYGKTDNNIYRRTAIYG